jgi:hypothetical protein
MKKLNNKWISKLTMHISAGLLLFAGGVQATVIGFSPSASQVDVGDQVTVAVSITDADDLYSYSLDVLFDPAVLQVVSVDQGPFLGTGGNTLFFPGFIDNTLGRVDFNDETLLTAVSGVSGDGNLFSLTFEALAAGLSPLEIAPTSGGLVKSDLTFAPYSSSTGSVRGAVPEPQILWLFGTGLLLLTRARARDA